MIAKVFIALARESPRIRSIANGFVWERAANHSLGRERGTRRTDVPWIDRFAASGCRAIISGDVNMRHRTHEKLALYHHGFVVIFSNLNGYVGISSIGPD